MHIFISWSGERSKTAALGLKSLVEDVFQEGIRVFISDRISPGEHWAQRLGVELEQSDFGVLCLTRENFEAPWLLFEAGAVAKKFGSSRLVPYVLDDLPDEASRSPLDQFQRVRADRQGTYKLIEAINSIQENAKPSERLIRSFERWWPDFEETLNGLRASKVGQLDARSDREILLGIFQRVEVLWGLLGEPHGVTTSLPRAEVLHLLNLRDQPKSVYTTRDVLKKELRHLRDLGFIKNKRPIASLPESFQLTEFFELNDMGRDFLKEHGQVP
jgi:hypothetical protein